MRTLTTVILLAILGIVLSSTAFADIPRLITFQGRMVDDVGDPVEGIYEVEFALYNDSTGGSPIWTETQDVEFIDGLFEVNLGTREALTEEFIARVPDIFLECILKGTPFSPRTRLTSSAFAYHAQTVAEDAITNRSILDGTIKLADLGQNGAVKGDVITWDGSSWIVEQQVTGDITGVVAGDGLTGGGGSGTVTLDLDTSFTDARYISGVTAGDGLTGGGSSGDVTLELANNAVDSNKILNGSISFSDLGPNGATDGDIIKWKTVAGGWIAAGMPDYVNETGDIMTGDLEFDHLNDGSVETVIDASATAFQTYDAGVKTAELEGSGSSSLYLYNSSGVTRSRIFGSNWGEINLYDEDEHITVSIDATAADGGQLRLKNEFGIGGITLLGGNTSNGASLSLSNASTIEKIKLDADGTGDFAVSFPAGAISATEMLNEPGIASHHQADEVILDYTMNDLDTVSITIPTAGYIVVEGSCYGRTINTTIECWGKIQIDENAGGLEIDGHYVFFGLGSCVDSTTPNVFPVFISRVYYKTAGTYKFRMEGNVYSSNPSWAQVSTKQHRIIAKFFPTSYGSVSTAVSAQEAGEFESAIPETRMDTNLDGTTSTKTTYRVDLRELEVKAAHARAAAEQAERELLEAQVLELRESQKQNE